MLFLNSKAFVATVWDAFKSCVQRNKAILKVTALSFFTIISVSMFLTVFALHVAPWLLDWLESIVLSERSYVVIPPPFTEDLYFFIFLNNVGHFWNSFKMLVWVPLVGTFILGLELLLNGVVIGALSVVVGVTRGFSYPIIGLVPHGIFEVPAFILESASVVRWQVTTIEMIMAKVVGKKVNSAQFKQDAKDTMILTIASVILFMIAAFVETYITPYLLGL